MPLAPSFVPQRVADPREAYALVRTAGAAILTGCGTSSSDAPLVASRVLGELAPVIPDPAPIKEGGGNKDRTYDTMPGVDAHTVPFQTGHTDGFAYGDAYPDYIFLLAVRPAERGGESIAVDTYALLDALATSSEPDDRDFLTFLTSEPIEQTEPTFRSSVSPIVIDNGRGRRMVRWTPIQRPLAPDAGEAARQRTFIDRWTALTYAASREAPRFTLQPGEALCLDNYRMLHGRTGFDDTERELWRIWAWSSEALRVPEGLLFSDSRYAPLP
jgi:alpha-ketoglutarate-dependent taurine dioxygenase